MNTPNKPRVGLALGSGAARGWAHIGVIRALEQAGIRRDVVCGTSIGALVGAAYAAGELDRLEQWVLRLGIKDVIAFMDVRMSGGLLRGERLMGFFRQHFGDHPIEELAIPFAAVATALHTGAEIWLRGGSTPCAFGTLVPARPPDDAVHPRGFGLQHQHHAGADCAKPHGGRAAGPYRGAAAGAPSPARISPGKGSYRGRSPLGGTSRAHSCFAQQAGIVSASEFSVHSEVGLPQ